MRYAVVHTHFWKGDKENHFIYEVCPTLEDANEKLAIWEKIKSKARSTMEEATKAAGLLSEDVSNFIDKLEIKEVDDNESNVDKNERMHILFLANIEVGMMTEALKRLAKQASRK